MMDAGGHPFLRQRNTTDRLIIVQPLKILTRNLDHKPSVVFEFGNILCDIYRGYMHTPLAEGYLRQDFGFCSIGFDKQAKSQKIRIKYTIKDFLPTVANVHPPITFLR